MISDDMPLVQTVLVLIAGLGSLNWGLVEWMDYNLLVELGLSGSNLGLAYLAIGAAGAVVLVDLLEIVVDEGPDASPLED